MHKVRVCSHACGLDWTKRADQRSIPNCLILTLNRTEKVNLLSSRNFMQPVLVLKWRETKWWEFESITEARLKGVTVFFGLVSFFVTFQGRTVKKAVLSPLERWTSARFTETYAPCRFPSILVQYSQLSLFQQGFWAKFENNTHTHHHDLTDMYQEKWSRSINSERFFDMSDGSRRVTVKHAWIAQNTNFTTPYQTFSSLENLYNTVLKPTEQFMVKNKNPDIPTSINNKKTACRQKGGYWVQASLIYWEVIYVGHLEART